MFDTAASRPAKWTATDYDNRQLMDWRPPKLVYPCSETEKSALEHLKNTFSPLPPYKQLEEHARGDDTLVTIDTRIPDGYIAFLENTAEQCTSPQTKHSQEGLRRAHHWVQRVDTAENLFRRLTDGYGISLMFGERHHQFIRNSNNWRGIAGVMLDLDVWRDAEHPEAPEPVYSLDELLQRYPLLAEICSFILPSASSLHEGRPFKARGIVLFDEPITDQRVYREFGDMLCSELDCILPNVTKNPVAVGFGNTHNARQAWRNNAPDTDWIQNAIEKAEQKARDKNTEREAKRRVSEARREAYRERTHTHNGIGTGENISAFIERCAPVAEMVRNGLLTAEQRNRYKWHQSNSPGSCEIIDGVIKIFSETMASASPTGSAEPINTHRFYLFQLTGLDLANESEQAKCREYLFERGYGDDPKAFTEKQRQQSRRYAVNTEHEHATSDIDTERDENKSVLQDWLKKVYNRKTKELLVLGSAAGTGKTTAAVTTADTLLYIAKTTGEADKVFEELNRKEEDVIRHRPRLFNRGHTDIDGNNDWDTLPIGLGEHQRTCTQPEPCNLHAELLGTPDAICQRCPAYTECTENGYLSQAEKERNSSKVIYAWSEVVACDKTFAERVKRICTADDILIVDEVNPLSLTQARRIDRDTLFDLTERFRQPHKSTADIYTTLKALLDHQSTAETPETFIAGIQQWIDSIEDINALDEKLERYPVGVTFSNTPDTAPHEQPFEAILTYQNQEVTVPVVDFETADDTHAYFQKPDTSLETDHDEMLFVSYSFLLKVGLATLDEPPRRYRNLLADLKAFIDENAGFLATAPFTFDAKTQTFEFHLKPTLNHRRAIFNTASDPDNLISEAYRETDINITRHTGTPPAWKTDNVFQIASGNYLPRHSLVKNGADGNLHLKARAQELIDGYIQTSIKAGIKVLVVAPKAFQECESVKQWAVTELDDYTQGRNAMLINHHHAEGRNDYQDFDIVFVFHYEPNHNEIPIATKRIYRNPETPINFTREKRTVTLGGVSFEKNVYVDDRVQAVYNRECRARLMQSAMRLRPNINEGKTIVFFTAEPVDIPVTPVPFKRADANDFTGEWADFKQKLQAKAKASVQERIDAGDSKSKAYRDSSDTRKQEKATLKKQVYQWHDDGVAVDEIANRTGKHRTTIERWLKGTQKYVQKSQSVISNSNSAMGKMHTPPDIDVTGIDSETASETEERPRPQWHDDPYYSADAIRQRLIREKAKQDDSGTPKTDSGVPGSQKQDATLQLEFNTPAHEDAVILELNAGIFDRLAISEKLSIDVEVVRAVLEKLRCVDPRLTAETQQKLKSLHLSRRPPAFPPAHERPPLWIPLPWRPPENWQPPEDDTDEQIEKRYRDGQTPTEIADGIDLPVEYVRTLLDSQQLPPLFYYLT